MPISPPTNFASTVGDGKSLLSWRNASEASITGTEVRAETSGYPMTQTSGSHVVDLSGGPLTFGFWEHSELANGTAYYYTAFSHDTAKTDWSPAHASAQDLVTPLVTIIAPPASGFASDFESGIGWATQLHALSVAEAGLIIYPNPSGDVR